MPIVHPHINFNGNAEEAFLFYQSVLGGEFSKMIRFKDLANENFPIAPHEENKMMLISLRIGPTQLMANDVPEFMGKTNEQENRSKIVYSAESREDAERIFKGLSVGGEIEMPMEDGLWGTFLVMFRDKYGIEWMVEYEGE